MQKISHSTNTADVSGEFTEGSSVGAIPATLITAAFLNCIQRELVNVIEGAGLALNPDDNAQLLAAIRAIASGIIAAATTEKAGVIELATAQEGIAGLDQTRAIVPSVLAAVLANFAKLDSPVFTGAPKVPTAALGTNTLQAASTAFVQLTVAALVDSSPAALNTLNELAAALGDDPNFATTVTNALASKQPLSGNLTALAGLVGAANQLGYFTGAGAMALTAFTTLARQVLAAADAPTARTVLGACGISGPVSQTLLGTAVDFTAIPSWAKRLRVGFNGASLNAAAAIMAQLGTAAGIVANGYGGAVTVTVNGAVSAANLSAGADLDNPSGPDASMVYSGLLEFEHMGGNVWAFKSTISRTDNTRQTSTSGAVVLPGALTTLRLTSHNGTASFDAGTASLTYEG